MSHHFAEGKRATGQSLLLGGAKHSIGLTCLYWKVRSIDDMIDAIA